MDNIKSFTRFFGSGPIDVVRSCSIKEEWGMQTPDKDPIASPMADHRVSEVRLAMVRGGSDRTRLASPARPEVNPYTGPQTALVLSRNAVSKLGGSVLQDLRSVVAEMAGPTQKLQELSLRRLDAARGLIDSVNHWAGDIQVRSLAGNRP